ncbi:MAG: nucleoside hydrolase [Actinomycetaceae bacterium]|nr:nucleoside hydrolase [Actinomycetaceae bacterium]MDY6082944.1 nucleoside hydrolase [Actinomycetaceae bacterium]
MNTVTRTRILLDIDTGVDDALALAYALGSESAEVCGVIASYGNVNQATALRNTRAVLEVLGRTDVPVYSGATCPVWAQSFIPDAGCEAFHGANGLANLDARDFGAQIDTREPVQDPAPLIGTVSVGGYRDTDVHAQPASRIAVTRQRASQILSHGRTPSSEGARAIVDAVRTYGTDVTIVTCGPLTDVADALSLDPSIAKNLRVVFMGGALTQPGNCYDGVSETNIIQDPEAADMLFHSGSCVTMVGLDVTHQCILSASVSAAWRAQGRARSSFLASVADFGIHASMEGQQAKAEGMPLHDPLAVAVAVDPTLVRCFDISLQAQTAGHEPEVRGRTVGDAAGLNNPNAPVTHVALAVDARRFLSLFDAAVASF